MSDATSKPVRIQLSRKKGWRMPENTVKVDRSTQWGNPFPIAAAIEAQEFHGQPRNGDTPRETAIRWFREQVIEDGWILEPLRGKNLACWCPLHLPCHADVLLELANKDTQP